MPVKLTISLDDYTEQSIKALARKRRTTVSGLIRDFVKAAAGNENPTTSPQGGLGTILRASHSLLPDTEKDYKTLLGELREEKHKTRE
jgi:hypothetical protein